MEYMRKIEAIEQRAQAVNLSLHRLCQSAHVRYHCITRWRNGQVNPTVPVLMRELGKLEAELDCIEARIFRQLEPRFASSPAQPHA